MEYDDRLTIMTPEGVDLSLTLAGPGSRFVSALVDALIQWGTIFALALLLVGTDVFGPAYGVRGALFLIAFFVVFWGYDVFFEVLASGRTPGKRMNGLRVVRVGGQPVTFLPSSIRNLLRLVDFLPSGYLVGVILVLATPKNQRLGDIVAGTIVVRERRASHQAPAPPRWLRRAEAGAAPAWDTTTITPDELAAVRAFLDRRDEIELAPRNELAQTLEARLRPKVVGAPDDVRGERFLEQLAAAKSGRR